MATPSKKFKQRKHPKNAREALRELLYASDHGDPPYKALVRAVTFLLRREAEKEREERAHERIAEDALEGCFDPYGGGR